MEALNGDGRNPGGPLLLVSLAVAMNVASAVIMKLLAIRPGIPATFLVTGLTVVVALHGARMVVWGVCHRRYPLSGAFPLSSLFFPLMIPVALAFGEPVGLSQYAGAALIFAGVFYLTLRGDGATGRAAR